VNARQGGPQARRTLQRRLAALYGGAFFALGLLVLALPYALGRATPAALSVPGARHVDLATGTAVASAQRSADIHQQLVLSLVALVILTGVSAALGWALAERTLRPLRTITATAKEISASNLHRRLDIQGPDDELRELGATLDDLLARLEASFDSQRHFVSNASHELRTPLTAERALLQVALADPHPSVESLRSVCEELLGLGAQHERLIDDLLTLAQSEGGIDRVERFDLSAIARTALRARQPEASRGGVVLESSCVQAPVLGDRRLVTILVGNLLDNAIRHNVPDGSASVRTSFSGRGATLAVSNSGPPVDERDVTRLCEPFTRAGGTPRLHAEGHGLGLAIVRAVADAHHAELRVRARAQGGLAVDVTFPSRGPGQP
jgi:signal transduction histidine kinase